MIRRLGRTNSKTPTSPRYQREKGYEATTSENEQREVEQEQMLQQAIDDTNKMERRPNSSTKRVDCMSVYECWVLATLPDTDFAQHLTVVKEPSTVVDTHLRFLPPNPSTVLAYIRCMRETRKNKYNTIRGFLCSLSMTTLDCSEKEYVTGPAIDKLMDEWNDEDEEERAPVFDPEDMLPRLWLTIWEKYPGNYMKRLTLWTHVLIQLATVSRSSDISWSKLAEYCPLIGDI